ncbi:hypothetical protein GGX14DRAFT_542379 [Mycena pura]|uniref:Uncharacterized protein n=1 Tax=Mycena pura TaxID=153505 RepID=A0AAD6YDK6_9AGAR|nr:hypothetical protein GGX14DRAFT_542379 [Mycena pura]
MSETLNLTLESLFGPILVGAFFAIASHAILIVRSYALYERTPALPQHWKALAGITWFVLSEAMNRDSAERYLLSVRTLDFIRIVFLCQMAYQMFVVNWGNVLSLARTPEPLILYLGFSGAQTLLCQWLLLYRVFRKQLPLCGVLGLASIAAFVLNTFASIQLRMHKTTGYLMLHSGGAFLASLAIRAAVDAVVSMLLLGELKLRTNLALTRFITVIFASGLATSSRQVQVPSPGWLFTLHWEDFAAMPSSRTFTWTLTPGPSNTPCLAAELLSVSRAARSIRTATAEADDQVVEADHISAYEVNFAPPVMDSVRAWVATNPPADTRAEVLPESSRRSVLSDDYPPTYRSMGGPI